MEILLLEKNSGWKVLDFPENSHSGKWTFHRCENGSDDFKEWLAEKMKWNLGSKF